MKCQILFSRKNKKNIISLSSAEFVHSMVNVKVIFWKNSIFPSVSLICYRYIMIIVMVLVVPWFMHM